MLADPSSFCYIYLFDSFLFDLSLCYILQYNILSSTSPALIRLTLLLFHYNINVYLLMYVLKSESACDKNENLFGRNICHMLKKTMSMFLLNRFMLIISPSAVTVHCPSHVKVSHALHHKNEGKISQLTCVFWSHRQELIRRCLTYNQAERPDVLTIAQDPYLSYSKR